MLKELLRSIDVPYQRALGNASVGSAILAILTQWRRQQGSLGFAPPGGHIYAQGSQRTCPGVNGVPSGIPTAAGAPSPIQPGPGVASGKVQRSCQRQLIGFDQLPPVAVSPEPAYPMKISLYRAPGKMTSPPHLDNCAFAVIAKFHTHATLDAQMGADAQGTCEIIKRP